MAKTTKKKPPGGQGSGLSRADMRLTRQALRGDWPISTRIKTLAMEAVVNILVSKGTKANPISHRTRVMAVRTLMMLSSIAQEQALVDLKREKQEGKQSEVSLAELVSDAEQRAEQRKLERDT